MTYSKKMKALVNTSPKTLGVQLMLWAVEKDLSITRISEVTGATRQTVYNWARGGKVATRYMPKVKQLLYVLHEIKSTESEEVWSQVREQLIQEPSPTESLSNTSQ